MGGGKLIMNNDEIFAKVGSWAFLIGILIALIVGIMQAASYEEVSNDLSEFDGLADFDSIARIDDIFFRTELGGQVAWGLAIIGLIVGLLAAMGKGTITRDETQGFLLAGIALVVMGGIFPGLVGMYPLKPYIGSLLAGMSVSLAIFVAPVIGILAIKTIWDIERDV